MDSHKGKDGAPPQDTSITGKLSRWTLRTAPSSGTWMRTRTEQMPGAVIFDAPDRERGVAEERKDRPRKAMSRRGRPVGALRAAPAAATDDATAWTRTFDPTGSQQDRAPNGDAGSQSRRSWAAVKDDTPSLFDSLFGLPTGSSGGSFHRPVEQSEEDKFNNRRIATIKGRPGLTRTTIARKVDWRKRRGIS